MKGLTKRQREIVDFIRDYIAVHHYSPSYREIMKHFGFTSLGSVYKHIAVLKRKGGPFGGKGERSLGHLDEGGAGVSSGNQCRVALFGLHRSWRAARDGPAGRQSDGTREHGQGCGEQLCSWC